MRTALGHKSALRFKSANTRLAPCPALRAAFEMLPSEIVLFRSLLPEGLPALLAVALCHSEQGSYLVLSREQGSIIIRFVFEKMS